MPATCQIRVKPDEVHETELHRQLISKKLGVAESSLGEIVLSRRSIDSRGKHPVFELLFRVGSGDVNKLPIREPLFKDVSKATPVVIVGAGPCGLFAALRLIELGYKPIILERGKNIRERRRDVANVSRGVSVDSDSNYCFGLGGAGTFSDGKLYCRSVKPVQRDLILQLLVSFGADPDILVDTRPHIGTNKLPQVIAKIADYIVQAGGEMRYDSRVTRILNSGLKIKGVELSCGDKVFSDSLVLCTGHSAYDIFIALGEAGIPLQRKPFALGVRIEHPQTLIDQLQYGRTSRGEFLPAAYYSLKTQVEGHGVYSFCMCPGGVVCPATTREGELVVNGWSPSKRNSRYANSGIVVEVSEKDLESYAGDSVAAAMSLQKSVEVAAWKAGGGNFRAPAQSLKSFLENTDPHSNLPDCSYNPGVSPCDLSEVFPDFIIKRLRAGLEDFAAKMKGYSSEEALLIAPESRTSSVYRVDRDPQTLESTAINGLFPAGEGAGYAGGIMSAAVDGWRIAEGLCAVDK